MATGRCDYPNCTVSTTGNCLLSHVPPETCEHFSEEDVEALGGLAIEAPPAEEEAREAAVEAGRTFHLGNELGAEDAIEIMRARYAHLIGVLGSTAAGKTCLLSSLYLLASAGALPSPYQFYGSLTLQAFEDRARGLRRWSNGTLPDHLVERTTLADPRSPSLLHLGMQKLVDHGEGERIDLLITDLPGEWTNQLVARAANGKAFEFLRRADGIILVVDGTVLNSDSRHAELQRMRNFSDRLANAVGIPRDIPFVLMVSKGDKIDMKEPEDLKSLHDHISGLGFPVSAVVVSAFSGRPEQVPSGTGVFDAFEQILLHRPTKENHQCPDAGGAGNRSFQRFRG